MNARVVLTVATATLPATTLRALSGIRTHDLCDAGSVLSQLSYQSHMRAVVYGLALYMGRSWVRIPLRA